MQGFRRRFKKLIYVDCYDRNGNLTSDGQYIYIYDCENRLIEVRQNGSVKAEYKYDFAGRRVAKTVGSTTTTFLYDGDQIIQEYRDGYGRWKTYYYGPGIDELIRMIGWENPGEPGLSYYYDGLGNVVALADYMGNIVEKYSYDVFGKPTIKGPNDEPRATSSYGNRFMFTGREYDSETGNYYYRARYYKPSIGRFLQPDPISMYLMPICLKDPQNDGTAGMAISKKSLIEFLEENPIGRFLTKNPSSRLAQAAAIIPNGILINIDLNMYSYCLNNPLNFIDPLGLWTWRGVANSVWDKINSAMEAIFEAIKEVFSYPDPKQLKEFQNNNKSIKENHIQHNREGRRIMRDEFGDNNDLYPACHNQ